jgi:hypothetical protein
MSNSNDARALDRREFLQLVTTAGLASLMTGAVSAQAQTPSSPAAQAPAPTPPAGPSEDARALTAVLRRRFPDRLSDEQWESVAKDFEGDLALGKRLRALKLKNGDEPDSTFKA